MEVSDMARKFVLSYRLYAPEGRDAKVYLDLMDTRSSTVGPESGGARITQVSGKAESIMPCMMQFQPRDFPFAVEIETEGVQRGKSSWTEVVNIERAEPELVSGSKKGAAAGG